jgi:glycosyltransferase involved in cell wall biosynthesis
LGRLTARRILVVSTATRREQVGLARRSEQVMTLHNGLIGGPPGDRPRPRHRGASPQRLVVTGARHHPDKGLDVLIRAFAIVRAAEPSARAVIAGAVQPGYEEHHDELVRLIVRLGLQDAISMPGLISDPLPLWAEADVYVQPSRREPFGLGLIEAMSVGTPVIATSVGGMTEIVEADRSGLQVPPDDPDALAEAIRRVLTDAELATRLATGGLDRAQQFSMQRMVDRLCAVYAEATA